MALVVNSNIASLNAQRNLNKSQSSLNTSLQRLSSGLRINSAKDDAAGLYVSEQFTRDIRGSNQAGRNAADGISLGQTAEGALGEISNNLQRIREIAIQASNATVSSDAAKGLQKEVDQLTAEITRVVKTTNFNGTSLLSGSGADSNLNFQIGASSGDQIGISLSAASLTGLSMIKAAAGTDGVDGVVAGLSNSGGTTKGGTLTGGTATGGTLTGGLAKGGEVKDGTATTSVDSAITGGTVTHGKVSFADAMGKISFTGTTTTTSDDIANVTKDTIVANHVYTLKNVTITGATITGAAIDDVNVTGGSVTGATVTGGSLVGSEITGGTVTDGTTTDGTTTDAKGNVVAGGTITSGTTTGGTTTGGTVTDGTTKGDTKTTGGITTGATTTKAGLTGATVTNATVTAKYNGNGTFTIVTGNNAGTATTDPLMDVATTADTKITVDTGSTIDTTTNTANVTTAGKTVGGETTLDGDVAGGVITTTGGTTTGDALSTSGSSAMTTGSATHLVDISNPDLAKAALSKLSDDINTVSSARATFGAVQNRFESVISNLQNYSENLSAARSRVQDADFAAETASLTRSQILQQAGVSILAQANSAPQAALSLLQ